MNYKLFYQLEKEENATLKKKIQLLEKELVNKEAYLSDMERNEAEAYKTIEEYKNSLRELTDKIVSYSTIKW